MSSINLTARVAGFLYLFFIATLIFGRSVRSKLIISGDAVATANNIKASEGLFRLGFMSDMLSAVLFLLVAWALYVLLSPVNKNLALLFLLLNLSGVAVQCINMLNQLAALLLLRDADYLKVFPADQLQNLGLFFLNLHTNGFMIAQVFYGAWLFPLGYLVFKSGFLPGILGILLIIDCVGVLIAFFQFFLFPEYKVITYPGLVVSFIAEISLGLWLLIKGAWNKNPPLIRLADGQKLKGKS